MIEQFEHGDVLELRMNRPPVNALNPDMVNAISRAITDGVDKDRQGLVLSGQPGMFSAGLDVPELLQLDRAAMQVFWKSFFGLMRQIAECPIPIVAAITGHSPAGGLVLALFCDTRITSAGDFKLGLNEVQVGLPLPPVVLYALRRQVGARRAEKLGVSGALINPQEALQAGLVDAVVENSGVIAAAVTKCNELARIPKTAMQVTRQLARADLCGIFTSMSDEDHARMTDIWFSEETQATMQRLVSRLKEKK
ncbi:MAG: enoyl-CoA hydratase/isomerase family protein [Gammaproteobacteria bacterium]|nr:enoyl-CoA hydratase/isomerase family protein [Gammaproteobacteria bacterium]